MDLIKSGRYVDIYMPKDAQQQNLVQWRGIM